MNEILVRNENGTPLAEGHSEMWFTPRCDIWENENEYVLMADLPGVAPEGLDLTYENQELTIHGKVASRAMDAPYFADEYGVGNFRRSFTLGEVIDESQISAELKDGVLMVRLPKRAEARPRKIKIQTA